MYWWRFEPYQENNDEKRGTSRAICFHNGYERKVQSALSCQIKKLGKPLKDIFKRIQNFPHLS